MVENIEKDLRKYASPERAVGAARFFKTGRGQYGEGDVFIGVTVPDVRKVAKEYKDLNVTDIQVLVNSPIHEERLLAVIILVLQSKKADERGKEKLYKLYLKNTKNINNWDLVDVSAEHVVGGYLDGKDTSILRKLAHSKSVWERRIAILSTFHFIKKGNSKETFTIAELLLHDTHDLIHKAVGWMLREVGKRCSLKEEMAFLDKHYKTLPRTMLRYAIEKFPEREKKKYMSK